MQWSSDAKKYATNLKRHGVRFEDAALVFDDPFARIKDDSAHESGRLQIIGVRTLSERMCFSSSTSRSTMTPSG